MTLCAHRHVQSSLALTRISPTNLASHRRAWCPLSTDVALTLSASEPWELGACFGSCQIITDLSSEADATARSSGAQTTLRGWYPCQHCRQKVSHVFIHSFIHSLHAFQSADQVRCSRHSMAALQPALSWCGTTGHVKAASEASKRMVEVQCRSNVVAADEYGHKS